MTEPNIKARKRVQNRPGTRQKPNWLTHKDLVKLVAAESRYHLYECDDVINALHKVLHDAFLQGKSWRIREVGHFGFKLNKPRWYYDRHGRLQRSDWSRTMTFVPEVEYQKAIKEYFRENVLPNIEMIDDVALNQHYLELEQQKEEFVEGSKEWKRVQKLRRKEQQQADLLKQQQVNQPEGT